MDQTVLLTTLPLIGVVIGATLQHFFGRSLETRKQLAAQRSQSYVDYFKAFALNAQHGPNKDNLSALAEAKVRICIYGSAGVVKRLRAFEDAGAVPETPEAIEAVTALLAEMRDDSGAKTEPVAEEDLFKILFRLPRSKNP